MTKILIVEDDQPIRDLYAYKLKLEGHQVIVAEDGEVGLQQAKKYAPDLILLDIKMPNMGGDEMLKKLRAEDWGARIRVIILTNISRDEAPSVFRFLNVDRYVVKAHHTPKQIAEIVTHVLK